MSEGPQDGVVHFVGPADPAAPRTGAPSTAVPARSVLPGMWWLDTKDGPPFHLRRRNEANTGWNGIGPMLLNSSSVRLAYDAPNAAVRADVVFAVRHVAGDATVQTTDAVVVVDAPGAATVRLPPAVGMVGRVLVVCRQSQNGAVTVQADGADRIWGPGANGVATQALQSRGGFIHLLGEAATTWRVIASGGNVQLLDAPQTLPATGA